MTEPRFTTPREDAELDDWRRIHNLIIPTHELSAGDVRDRARRHRLELAHLEAVAVGCSTVRPPSAEAPAVTVIARVLPGYRGRGLGTRLYTRALAAAAGFGVADVETVVLASNPDGLRFALRQGFTEVERYLLPGDTVEWITLRRAL